MLDMQAKIDDIFGAQSMEEKNRTLHLIGGAMSLRPGRKANHHGLSLSSNQPAGCCLIPGQWG